MNNGTVKKTTEGYLLRFERQLQHPPERVWTALTDPARLADWLADATIELQPGGRIQLRFGNTGSLMAGKVLRVQPPTLFEYTWNSPGATDTVVRWELQPQQGGCRLLLTHRFPNAAGLPSMLAGWHTHLEGLPDAAAGRRVEWPWSRWEELHKMYADQLAPTGMS